MSSPAPRRQRVGLVLGSGSARGWAHIGVLRGLAEAGVEPDVVCGCSIGALVGAAAASGELDKLEAWVRQLTWQEVLGLMDLSLNGGGLLKGDKLMAFFERHFADRDIAALPIPFGCTATDLASGREIWLREGSVAAAVRASCALPGLFTPMLHDDRLLVDGGLVDPVPVSLCRAMGADIVIAVDVGADIVSTAFPLRTPDAAPEQTPPWGRRLLAAIGFGRDGDVPTLTGVLATSLHIMQTRIARSRLAGEPADVLIKPRLGNLALLDYHRAAEAIAEGRAAVQRMMPMITHALEL